MTQVRQSSIDDFLSLGCTSESSDDPVPSGHARRAGERKRAERAPDDADWQPVTPDNNDDGGHGLLLPFDVDDPEFARGFEAGRIWEMMERAKDAGEEFTQTAHALNAEMFIRMGEQLGIEVGCEILDDTWLELRVAGWVLIDDEGAELS